jgi:Gram-negative bacterial TonB protein C-terminal
MRFKLAAVICSFLLNSLFAQPAEPGINTVCIEKLQIPSYPALAREARLSGVVVATITLNSDATVKDISMRMESATASANKAFTSAVETALSSSVYTPGCGGKPIKLIFSFVLGQHFLPNRDMQKRFLWLSKSFLDSNTA